MADTNFRSATSARTDTASGMPRTDADVAAPALNFVDWIALILLIIGGLNWGLVGLLNVDLVASIFGTGTPAARIVYVLVGLAALWSCVLAIRLGRRVS